MIERWSRVVFDKTLDYSKLGELDAEKAENRGYRRPSIHSSKSSNHHRSEYGANPFQGRIREGKEGPISERAHIPAPVRFDFMHRPQSKVVDPNGSTNEKKGDGDSRKSRLSKRMQEISRPGRKGKRSVGMSIEGR